MKHHLSLIFNDHVLLLARQTKHFNDFIDILNDKGADLVLRALLTELKEHFIHEFESKCYGLQVFLVLLFALEFRHDRLLILIELHWLFHFRDAL